MGSNLQLDFPLALVQKWVEQEDGKQSHFQCQLQHLPDIQQNLVVHLSSSTLHVNIAGYDTEAPPVLEKNNFNWQCSVISFNKRKLGRPSKRAQELRQYADNNCKTRNIEGQTRIVKVVTPNIKTEVLESGVFCESPVRKSGRKRKSTFKVCDNETVEETSPSISLYAEIAARHVKNRSPTRPTPVLQKKGRGRPKDSSSAVEKSTPSIQDLRDESSKSDRNLELPKRGRGRPKGSLIQKTNSENLAKTSFCFLPTDNSVNVEMQLKMLVDGKTAILPKRGRGRPKHSCSLTKMHVKEDNNKGVPKCSKSEKKAECDSADDDHDMSLNDDPLRDEDYKPSEEGSGIINGKHSSKYEAMLEKIWKSTLNQNHLCVSIDGVSEKTKSVSAEKSVCCLVCNEVFALQGCELKSHVRNEHNVLWTKYVGIYNMGLDEAENFITSLQKTPQTSVVMNQPLKCLFCENESNGYKFLISHIRSLHGNADGFTEIVRDLRRLVCEIGVKRKLKLLPSVDVGESISGAEELCKDLDPEQSKSEEDNQSSVEEMISAPPLQCCICMMRFSHEKTLDYHLSSHNTDLAHYKTITTSGDEKSIKSFIELSQDFTLGAFKKQMVEGSMRSLYSCPLCVVMMVRRKAIELHLMDEHTDHEDLQGALMQIEAIIGPRRCMEQYLLCPICSRHELTSYMLSHMVEAHSQAPQFKLHYHRMSQEVATLKVEKMKNNRKHHRTKHNWVCRFKCGGSWRWASSRYRHEKTFCRNNPDRQPRYECIICRKFYENLQEYETHMESHPDRNVKVHHCNECERSFSRQPNLRKHERAVHGRIPTRRLKRHYCTQCSIELKDGIAYKNHMNKHSGVVFICDVCGKKLTTMQLLRRHKNLIHFNKYPYRCNDCGHGMEKKQYVETHKCGRQKRKQGEKTAEKDLRKEFHLDAKPTPRSAIKQEKSKNCDICKKTFKTAALAKRHTAYIHFGLYPYRCDKCGHGLEKASYLARHKCGRQHRTRLPGCLNTVRYVVDKDVDVADHADEIDSSTLTVLKKLTGTVNSPLVKVEPSAVNDSLPEIIKIIDKSEMIVGEECHDIQYVEEDGVVQENSTIQTIQTINASALGEISPGMTCAMLAPDGTLTPLSQISCSNPEASYTFISSPDDLGNPSTPTITVATDEACIVREDSENIQFSNLAAFTQPQEELQMLQSQIGGFETVATTDGNAGQVYIIQIEHDPDTVEVAEYQEI